MDDLGYLIKETNDETRSDRGARMFSLFIRQPNSCDLAIRTGVGIGHDPQHREPAIIIEFAGERFPFTTHDARLIGEVFDHIVDEHVCGSNTCAIQGLDLFAGFIREGCDDSERLFKDGRGRLQ